MTISTLGTLRTAVNTWLGRTLDSSLFVEFAAEVTGYLHNGMRDPSDRFWIVPPLRVRAMEETATLTVTSASAAFPTGMLEPKRLWIDSQTGTSLKYVPLQSFRDRWQTGQTGEPTIYTVEDSNFRFAPTSDASVEISFYEELEALSADGDDNVVLLAHPQVYRRGCMWLALDWQGPDDDTPADRTQSELAAFGSVVKGLNRFEKNSHFRGSPLISRTVGNTP